MLARDAALIAGVGYLRTVGRERPSTQEPPAVDQGQGAVGGVYRVERDPVSPPVVVAEEDPGAVRGPVGAAAEGCEAPEPCAVGPDGEDVPVVAEDYPSAAGGPGGCVPRVRELSYPGAVGVHRPHAGIPKLSADAIADYLREG